MSTLPVFDLGPVLKARVSGLAPLSVAKKRLLLERVVSLRTNYFYFLFEGVKATSDFTLGTTADQNHPFWSKVSDSIPFWYETARGKTHLGEYLFQDGNQLTVIYFLNALWLMDRGEILPGSRGSHIACKMFLLYSSSPGVKNVLTLDEARTLRGRQVYCF